MVVDYNVNMEEEKPSKESGKSSSELRRERRARRWRKRDSSGEQYTGHKLCTYQNYAPLTPCTGIGGGRQGITGAIDFLTSR